MPVSLKHNKTSSKPDGDDDSLIQPSDWNDEHTLTMATAKLLGRTSAGDGAVEELSVGAGLTLAGGSLAAKASWMDLVAQPSEEVGTATVSGEAGVVRKHTKAGAADIFRFIPTDYDPALDGFYSTYSAGALSGLITTRG